MEVDNLRIVETGTWEDVVAFCYRLSEVLEPAVPPQHHEQFEQWRPKPDEARNGVADRTNDHETMQETRIERDSDGAKKELTEAGRKMKDGGKDAMQGKARDTMKDVGEAGSASARGLVPMLIRLARSIEHGIYQHIVGRTSPDFFECPLFTVSIDHRTMQGDQYRVQVNFDDGDFGEDVADQLRELKDIGDGVD